MDLVPARFRRVGLGDDLFIPLGGLLLVNPIRFSSEELWQLQLPCPEVLRRIARADVEHHGRQHSKSHSGDQLSP